MNAHPVEFKAKALKACRLAFLFLIISLLTACSSSAPTSLALELTPEPANQPQAGSHPPVILRTVARQEVRDGLQYAYDDIYFNDPDGDAVAVTYREVTFLLFCLLLLLTFVQRILHEGGYASYLFLRGVPITIYVHPFTFPGYARPVIDSSV